MPQTIGSRNYPANFQELLQDKDLFRVFTTYMQRSGPKLRTCMNYCAADASASQRYDMFFTRGAPHKMPLPPNRQTDAEFAAAEEDWDRPEFQRIIKDYYKLCVSELNRSSVPGFFKSDVFDTYHRQKCYSGDTRHVAKKLGLKKASNIKLLQDLLDGIAYGPSSKVETAQKKLQSSGMLGPLRTRNVVEELKHHGILFN